jgi:hypothetical protein
LFKLGTNKIKKLHKMTSEKIKKLINKKENIIEEELEGIIQTYEHITMIKNSKILIRADIKEYIKTKVSIISVIILKIIKKGGGSVNKNNL